MREWVNGWISEWEAGKLIRLIPSFVYSDKGFESNLHDKLRTCIVWIVVKG